MNRVPPFKLRNVSIRASAGSGKTFQLTNWYLDLMLGGVPCSAVLASTFTRLAAGEIRDRLFSRLADAAGDEKSRTQLARHLTLPLPDRDAACAALRHLVNNLHLLQVRTLDSFFGSVVSAFAIELGLPAGATVHEGAEAAQLRLDAIQRMLDERNPQALIDLLRRLTQGSTQRSVMKLLDGVVTDLHTVYRQAPAEAWETIESRPVLHETSVVGAIEDLENVILPEKKSLEIGRANDVRAARARDWSTFLKKGIAGKLTQDELSYKRVPIPENLIAAYEPLLTHAQGTLINRVREQTIATRDLLALFEQQYESIKQERRVLTFSDITEAMVRAQEQFEFSDMYYRLDARVHHVLFDEFQDTSVQQWRAVAPLALEILSDLTQPRTFFCVGDVKQSIYGWRDACPEILDQIPELLRAGDGAPAVEEEHLAESWRSSPAIMDTVNGVFESLCENEALAEHADAAEAFTSGFDAHSTALTEQPGYVRLETVARPDDGETTAERRLITAADHVAALHARAPHRSIAVLTRTNESVTRLRYELGPSMRQLPVTGRGGGPLTDAPPVNVVLDLLTLADHPDDTIAAFNVACSPLGTALDSIHALDAGRRRGLARLVRRQLLDRGYAGTISTWVDGIAHACDAREHRRLMQLINLADLADESPSLRATAFVKVVETTPVPDVQPAPIQIMTVHQAKGLEFDIVVLPDLESLLQGRGQAPVVIEREGPVGKITRVSRWMNKELRSLVPELAPMFQQHTLRTVRESLSLLYVAMTRARQGLYMFIDPARELKGGALSPTISAKPSSVVKCALYAAESVGPETVLFEAGDKSWIDTPAETPPNVIPVQPDGPIVLREPAPGSIRGGAAPSASAQHGGEATLGSRLQLSDDVALAYGTAMHRLFEEVEWIDTAVLEPETMIGILKRESSRAESGWHERVVKEFLTAVEMPAVQEALSLGGRDPARVEVYRELPFARLVGGQLQRGFIDRVEVERDDDGQPVRAVIVDYKTDRVTADELADRAEHYRAQLAVYRDAVHELFGVAGEAIEMRLVFVSAGAWVGV